MTRQERKILNYDPDVIILHESLLNHSVQTLSRKQIEIMAYAMERTFEHCAARRKGFAKFQKLSRQLHTRALPAAELADDMSFNQQGKHGKSRRIEPPVPVSVWRPRLIAVFTIALSALAVVLIMKLQGRL